MSKIPTKVIQDTTVPVIGLGTYELEGDECREAVSEAIHLGYRHIDTARMYENEEDVGLGILDTGIARDDLFLTSKVWWEDLDEKTVINEIEASLEALRTDYLDLVLIHWPNPDIPLYEPLGALEMLQESELIRYFGVSNFSADLLTEAIQIASIFSIQVEYHPLLDQTEILHMAQRHDLLMTSYSPLARGDVAKYDAIREVAKRHGKTPYQVALRWLIDQPKVAAIPKSSDPTHLRENIEIFDFELDGDDLAKIANLPGDVKKVNPDFATV